MIRPIHVVFRTLVFLKIIKSWANIIFRSKNKIDVHDIYLLLFYVQTIFLDWKKLFKIVFKYTKYSITFIRILYKTDYIYVLQHKFDGTILLRVPS